MQAGYNLYKNASHVVIIGGGLGGLQCGYILAKNGLRVTVLEQDVRLGGCLQSFRRGQGVFDTGFHYVGGLREGESLHGLFKYFNLLDLPWVQLDEDCFDEVVIGEQSYPFATGHKRFVERLAEFFPHERQQLAQYAELLRQTGEHITEPFLLPEGAPRFADKLFSISAYSYLNSTISNPLLRKVLSGTSLKMELTEKLPLYVFSQINNSYIESAWRLRGGGQMIAEHLAASIREMGGEVRTKAQVSRLHEKDGKVVGVTIGTGEYICADVVIASLHPQSLMQLLDENTSMRHIYRRRINALENTFGMFTAQLSLKPETVPYLNRNIYVYSENADPWHLHTEQVEGVLVSFYQQPTDSSNNCDCLALDLLTPMRWQQVEQWADTTKGKRGDSYVNFKKQKIEECLTHVADRLPLLSSAIDRAYSSTPITYNYYTSASKGSAYGIAKDYASLDTTILSPMTPLQSLLLTGQNLNLHGVLGTSMTSVLTCARILGIDQLRQDMDIAHWR